MSKAYLLELESQLQPEVYFTAWDSFWENLYPFAVQ